MQKSDLRRYIDEIKSLSTISFPERLKHVCLMHLPVDYELPEDMTQITPTQIDALENDFQEGDDIPDSAVRELLYILRVYANDPRVGYGVTVLADNVTITTKTACIKFMIASVHSSGMVEHGLYNGQHVDFRLQDCYDWYSICFAGEPVTIVNRDILKDVFSLNSVE